MGYAVFLKIDEATHHHFDQIHAHSIRALHSRSPSNWESYFPTFPVKSFSKFLAISLAQQKHKPDQSFIKQIDESEKVIQQVMATMKKYLPWSVSFFSNERLLPLVNYLASTFRTEAQTTYMRYSLDSVLVQDTFSAVDKVRAGQAVYVPKAFQALTQIVDQGVTQLIRTPKQLLKFNLVVDKTLNGVIHMTTHLGYKRLEKWARKLTLIWQMTILNTLWHF